MKELTGPELRRWHGMAVAGILLGGSAAFALVFWVTVWGIAVFRRANLTPEPGDRRPKLTP